MLGSSAVHPYGTPKQSDGRESSAVEGFRVPPEVAVVLKRSCMDCHSNQTVWPWYSYMAPVSWMVERDVRRGRDHLNLSGWQRYTSQQKEQLLADIASAVKNGEMPLRQYTLVHRQAGLSDTERDRIYDWARAERRKLRASQASARPVNQRAPHD